MKNEENTFFAVSGAYNWFDDPEVELSWASAYTTNGGESWVTIDRDIPYTCIGFASESAGWVGTVGNYDYGFEPDEKPAVFRLMEITSSTEIQQLKAAITLSPNPFSDYLTVSSEKSPVEHILCFNAQGMQMGSFDDDELEQYDFSTFPPGIYFMQIHTKEGVVTKKLVKN